MFSLIKQVFIVLLSFKSSLTGDQTKCVSSNNEPCMFRPTLLDLNNYIISLDKCSGSYNVFSSKICVPKETKDVNVKAFNMITNKIEAEETKNISCHCKSKFNSTTCNSNQKWNNKRVNVNVKIIVSAKMIIVRMLGHVFMRIASI